MAIYLEEGLETTPLLYFPPNLKFPVFKIKRRKVFLGADKLNLLNVARNSLNISPPSSPSPSFHVVGFHELAAMKTRVLHNSSGVEENIRFPVPRDNRRETYRVFIIYLYLLEEKFNC